MASTGGISGTAVSVATLGFVLVYAGVRGVSPIQALRDAASGAPPSVEGHPTTLAPGTVQASYSTGASGTRSAVVAAAGRFQADIYSQARRTQAGYSDCSSFVDKCLKAAGVDPPFSPWANTSSFRMSPQWRDVPAAQAQPGDIAISSGHMVLVTGAGGSSGIGQQRTGVNVRSGPVRSLFSTSYVFKTWTGYGRAPTSNQVTA